ncbi:DUF2336 domain-containing protein [Hoeflea prorocentri]|uniref:DUF2336 domain-containing protein n=1 Tax=Hoeflea prorocentri TaxID=1922333 RepID=A0A9X3ZGE6_9HYPH|nr:DUF2336 domain-containing protein [Hoeflea prorocentri]MCY6380682.1 DUF2336 domain-containing protein [Hoeflea prorocentri]MDA5398482.1 DUF2336 domain-containing protein [Hoeflea prorocentri]
MIVQKFLQWSESAGARERARAANALSRAFVLSELSLEETRAAEAAMALLLDDPSPMVRQAMAEVLAASEKAPRSVIHSLAKDQIDIAGIVVCCSPLLGDQELVDLAADGRPGIQSAIAIRHDLRQAVCAALAEVAERPAVADMLDNPTARIAKVTLRRITERFGGHPEIRARLLDRSDLPGDVRHSLILKVGNALAESSFVAGIVGRGRVGRITDEACQAATLQLAGAVDGREIPALVEHLRLDGKLTPAFLMHALCIGNIEFFASAVGSIAGVDDQRVRAILVDGRRNAIQALYASSGLDAMTCEVFATATLLWRDATKQDVAPNALRITEQLIDHYMENGESGPVEELLLLVERMNLEFRRKAAKDYAMAIACEAA